MYGKHALVGSVGLVALLAASASAQGVGGGRGAAADSTPDPIRTMVGQLDLEKYKATIKGLTQFGDRRQGTKRNRDAVDWIEAQLKSYGCPTERLKYLYPPVLPPGFAAAGATGAGGAPPAGAAGMGGRAGGGRGGQPQPATGSVIADGRGSMAASGGGRYRGFCVLRALRGSRAS